MLVCSLAGLSKERIVMNVKAKLRLVIGSLISKPMISGQGIFSNIETSLARCTDHPHMPFDDKYVHEILFLVSNSPGSVTFLARGISRRLEKTRDQVVALKTLVLLHRLLRGGDRYFEQDVRNMCFSGDLRLNLRWFSRESNYRFSFLRYYALFLEERIGWVIDQAGKLEPVISTPSSTIQSYEESSIQMALNRLSKCQTFLDKIMNYSPVNIYRSSHLSLSAMNIILRESFRVYTSFHEGIETVENSFNNFKDQQRVKALNIFKRAGSQSKKLYEFYESCKSIIIGKNLEYPIVRIITAADVITMEQLLNDLKTIQKNSSPSTKFSSPPATISDHTKLTRLSTTRDEDEITDGKGSFGSSFTLFSSKLETKISTKWVEFDEDSQNSSFSFGGLDDSSVSSSNDLFVEWECLNTGNKTLHLL